MKIVICYLVLCVVAPVWALIPLEGILLGEVDQNGQIDPFEDAISFNYTSHVDQIAKKKINYL